MYKDFLYTDMTKAALKICFHAHKDQVDKEGMPYVFHPFHLAEQMETEEEVCTALLHDVMEDTDITPEELKEAGISDRVIRALDLLNHRDHVSYMDYVRNLAPDPLARKIKLADLHHNSDLRRLTQVTDKDRERHAKYREAISILETY